MKTQRFFFALLLCGCGLVSRYPASPLSAAETEAAVSSAGSGADAQDKMDDADQEDGVQSVDELAANCDRLDGLFTLLRDRTSGELYLLVKQDQLGKEFIFFSYTENGVVRLGHFRGQFRRSRIFEIQRDYNRLRFVVQPTRFYFSPDSPLRRSQLANVSPAVVAAEKIVALDETNGRYVVSADNLFLSEAFQQIKSSMDGDEKGAKKFTLGKLNKDKTRFSSVRNYPKNTDVVVEYVYDESAPAKEAEPEEGVTDSRYVTIKMQHSLIEMPHNGYRPRRDDPRVGYFMRHIDDMTSTSATPFRDVICRWDLQKKDPQAALSPPKQQIVWWLENTTPLEFRATIRKAVLAWNEAFEQAGFKNAVRVRMQPEDAEWDAGDLRYNVIRWTSSPDPRFGGYGPSFVNPRTGQILGADIMIEWSFVTNRVRYQQLFGRSATGPSRAAAGCVDGCLCDLSGELHLSSLLGRRALALQDAPQVELDRLMKESLYFLILHEVGHTLGLMHNFRSSQLHPLEQIHNRELTSAVGLTGSVMDYPAINLARSNATQGQYYTTKPGPYDKWAVEYGYSAALDDPVAEGARLEKLLSRSTEPELAFGNDADDMRYAGRGIDPRIMIGDLSSDAIAWAENRIQLVRDMTAGLLKGYDEPGQSYQSLRDSYFLLTRHHSQAAKTVSRYIGGIRVDRAVTGQPLATTPYRPVSREDQKRAMGVLAERLFAPDAFFISPELLAHLQQQRRGFDNYGKNEDVKVHDHILGIQSNVLDHLLHADVLQRITDSQLYGNEYRLSEFFDDLTAAIFDADAQQDVNTVRQNLQVEYVKRLTEIAPQSGAAGKSDGRGRNDYLSQSAALHQLRQILRVVDKAPGSKLDSGTVAHRGHLKLLIDRALAARYE